MGATPVFGFRFPEPPDPADVPTDMHELALDVETAINGALVPKPVVNGRFVKGVGGAAVWAALTAADIPPIGDAQIA
ncbi:MAG TPA: hypothetical protein VFA62_03630, partial [Acidimicrobiia bacterium]|nr:hypothetical protein [Acidimicrobiia bacterium]